MSGWFFSIRPVQLRRVQNPNWGCIWKEGLVCGEPAAKHLGPQDLEKILVLKGGFQEDRVALTSVLLCESLFASADPILLWKYERIIITRAEAMARVTQTLVEYLNFTAHHLCESPVPQPWSLAQSLVKVFTLQDTSQSKRHPATQIRTYLYQYVYIYIYI